LGIEAESTAEREREEDREREREMDGKRGIRSLPFFENETNHCNKV
jgi:hypothetical protein